MRQMLLGWGVKYNNIHFYYLETFLIKASGVDHDMKRRRGEEEEEEASSRWIIASM